MENVETVVESQFRETIKSAYDVKHRYFNHETNFKRMRLIANFNETKTYLCC